MRKAVDSLMRAIGPDDSSTATPADVTNDHLEACLNEWEEAGLAAPTINKRLSLLKGLGVTVGDHWVVKPTQLKWWLHPSECDRLLKYLRTPADASFANAAILADYIEWTAHVGMRVEESLRLTWVDVNLKLSPTGEVELSEVTVPGTKNNHSQASLALSSAASQVLRRLQCERPNALPNDLIFPVSYRQLHDAWQHARAFLNVQDNPLATLRSLRRTAARHLTVGGMPTAVVQRYLRHSNINTTMGYLTLVGGYTTEEQRKWLR